jgi:hypothetical protein
MIFPELSDPSSLQARLEAGKRDNYRSIEAGLAWQPAPFDGYEGDHPRESDATAAKEHSAMKRMAFAAPSAQHEISCD